MLQKWKACEIKAFHFFLYKREQKIERDEYEYAWRTSEYRRIEVKN